jgi:hypothetical protein
VGGTGRITVVVRPLDRALTVLRFALIPLLAVVVSLPVLRALTSSLYGAPRTWLITAGAGAVMAVYVLLLQTETVGDRVDRVIAQLRRRVAVACNHDEGAQHDDGRIACMLTPEMLRAPIFEYMQQRHAVAALTEACNEGGPGQFWFLEGNSGSGKTRTALRFVQSLARDRELFELGSRCFLFDFSDSKAAQKKLLKSFESTRHDRSIVVVDNFQLVDDKVLGTLTQRLIEHGGPIPQQLLVFLTRPGEAWNLSLGSDVRLLSEAKARSRYLRLAGPSSETVASCVYDCDPDAASLIRGLRVDGAASAAQLHFAQVIVRCGTAPPDVLAILQLLVGGADGVPPAEELVAILAIVTGLSMHRGTFSRRDVRRAARAVAHATGTQRSLVSSARMWITFRRFHRIGLVPKIQLDGTRFVFHEAIAELCIDRLSALPAFQVPFAAVGRFRMEDRSLGEDPLDKWLTAVEIGAQDALQVTTFDSALSQGAYNRMTSCLARARDRYVLSKLTRLQLAILLNRTGSFAESRAEFTDDLLTALGSSDELTAMLATSRMEATHEPAAEAGLEVLCRDSDRFVAVVGEYWKLHMEAHRGHFDSARLLELATEAFALMSKNDSYWRTYSLGRMHFDSLRHHYLEGAPTEQLPSNARGAIGDYLRKHLATFEALNILYTRAHLVGHTLLPNLAIFHIPVTASERALADISAESAASVDGLVKAAQGLYRRASDEFWQYGDRETVYLKAELLNSAMIETNATLDDSLGELNEYKRLFAVADYPSLASYPHFYFLRWNILKHYEMLARAAPAESGMADHHLDESKRHLARIVELDTVAGNRYGLLRAKLLGALLRAVREPLADCGLPALEQEMRTSGYEREARLLTHLIDEGAISQVDLWTIFRFYPFVNQ